MTKQALLTQFVWFRFRAHSLPDPVRRYRADLNGISLLDVFFTVKATGTGLLKGALTFATSPTANIPALSLWPSWSSPYYQFNSQDGASNSAGSIVVSPVSTLGMWAWSDVYDIFNTAALNGQQVSAALRGVLVRSFGSPRSSDGDVLSGCSLSPSSPRAAAATIDAVRRVCVVSASAANVVPAKQLAVTLSITDGASTSQAAQVGWVRGGQSEQACLQDNCDGHASSMRLHNGLRTEIWCGPHHCCMLRLVCLDLFCRCCCAGDVGCLASIKSDSDSGRCNPQQCFAYQCSTQQPILLCIPINRVAADCFLDQWRHEP